MENYYDVLGLQRFASLREVKAAFKRMALQYHPDRNPDNPEAEDKFKQINEAYQTLSDPQRKANYDARLENGVHYSTQVHTNEYAEAYRQAAERRAYFFRKVAEMRAKTISPKMWKVNLFVFLTISYVYIIVSATFHNYSQFQFLFGMQAYKNKEYEIAVKHFGNALGYNHDFSKAYYYRGLIYLEYFNYHLGAAAEFDLAIKKSVEPPIEYFLKRGIAYGRAGRQEASERDLALVRKIMPDNEELSREMAHNRFYRFQDYTGAKAEYMKLLKKNTNDLEILENLAFIAEKEEDYTTAIRYLSTTLKVMPNKAELYYKRALNHLYVQQLEQCCIDWTKAKSLDNRIKDSHLDIYCRDLSFLQNQ